MFSILITTGPVLAKEISPEDFFDFEYAKNLWLDVKTRKPMEELYDCSERDGGIFNKWEKKFFRQKQDALNELKAHPEAQAIKRCFDTHLTYKVWRNIYDFWRNDLFLYGGEGWNKNDNHRKRGFFEYLNIFTGEINDLPDWRSAKAVAKDEEKMAIGNATQARRNNQ